MASRERIFMRWCLVAETVAKARPVLGFIGILDEIGRPNGCCRYRRLAPEGESGAPTSGAAPWAAAKFFFDHGVLGMGDEHEFEHLIQRQGLRCRGEHPIFRWG